MPAKWLRLLGKQVLQYLMGLLSLYRTHQAGRVPVGSHGLVHPGVTQIFVCPPAAASLGTGARPASTPSSGAVVATGAGAETRVGRDPSAATRAWGVGKFCAGSRGGGAGGVGMGAAAVAASPLAFSSFGPTPGSSASSAEGALYGAPGASSSNSGAALSHMASPQGVA